MSATRGTLRIGTSGYHYAHWREVFYPRHLPQQHWLAYYAGHFNTVEINNTFYHLPQAQRFDGWRAQAPPDFCYALKCSRYGSHLKRLKEPHVVIARFLDRARRLRACLGPILVQLPPHWRPEPTRLAGFLQAAPVTTAGPSNCVSRAGSAMRSMPSSGARRRPSASMTVSRTIRGASPPTGPPSAFTGAVMGAAIHARSSWLRRARSTITWPTVWTFLSPSTMMRTVLPCTTRLTSGSSFKGTQWGCRRVPETTSRVASVCEGRERRRKRMGVPRPTGHRRAGGPDKLYPEQAVSLRETCGLWLTAQQRGI
jgi:hypothetical protein